MGATRTFSLVVVMSCVYNQSAAETIVVAAPDQCDCLSVVCRFSIGCLSVDMLVYNYCIGGGACEMSTKHNWQRKIDHKALGVIGS